jgi:CubicO group peptidase (beta-lactamase class C family)
MRLLAAALVWITLCEGETIQRLDGTKIDSREAERIAREELTRKAVAGAQIAVLNQGKLVWSYAFGVRTKQPDAPMTTDTGIWAASITKGAFGLYVMKLVKEERFPLDQPIVSLLTKPLNEYEPYRETASEIVKDARLARVTPRILLSHTSGLLNFAAIEPDRKMRLHFEPGAKYWYSGEGLNLLQFVIEQMKGKPLAELMQEAIFKPYGMTRTGMIFDKAWEGEMADRFDDKGAFIAKTRRFPARAAGSMTTTVNDLARMAAAMLKDPPELLMKPQIGIETYRQFPRENEPQVGEEAKRVGLAYGLGWGLLQKTKYGPAFFKEGHGDGAQNMMICFVKSQSCMIILTNSDNGERAYRTLFGEILGNTVSPWVWHGYDLN